MVSVGMNESAYVRRIEKITKLEAAERQLRTACRLFLEDADSVSIHALAFAAHELLYQLVGKQGSVLRNTKYIRPGREDEWRKALDKAKNFFKHAGKDRNVTLEFYPDMNPLLLFDCGLMYETLNGKSLPEASVVITWCGVHYPELLEPHPLVEECRKKGVTTKQEFLLVLDNLKKNQGAK